MKKIILFGSGYMAGEYLKILKSLHCDVTVIGRRHLKAKQLASSFGYEGFGGGVKALKNIDTKRIDYVINAAHIDSLTAINLACLDAGLNNILIEKPGALNGRELQQIRKKAPAKAKIHIAYNRRFYNSVLMLENILKREKRIEGLFFDFTDREKDVLRNSWSPAVVKRWGWANAAHVIDLAFFLIGEPKQINVLRDGGFKGIHKTSTFVGSGKTSKCLFSYFATWAGGGRWNIEVSTREGRYKLSPLEELQFCKKNQFRWESMTLKDSDDHVFKPGLKKMVKALLFKGQPERLPDLSEQIKFCRLIERIFGYEK